jgi:LA2681-like HEPN
MTSAAQSVFDKLMVLGAIGKANSVVALKRIGILIDLAGDIDREDGTTRAFEWCEDLGRRSLTDRQAALLDYFRANAWANRQRAKHRDPDAAWQWDQPELQQQVFHLRRAAQSPGFKKLPSARRCQILTNLANQLSTVGRTVDAIATWTDALSINPAFGMALGNRGYGLMQYARSLYDTDHKAIILYFAHKDLTASLRSRSAYGGKSHAAAKDLFAAKKAEIESIIDVPRVGRTVTMDNLSLGASERERDYRSWALYQRLFLNPLNDLGRHSIAASDGLSLPSYVTPIREPPTLIGFFNQMKQEYVSARWLLYDGLHSGRAHFSDRRVTIFNTLDYPTHSLAIEKVKAAYRVAYSLLDKIAYFLNDYEKLRINPRQIYFRTVWYENNDAKKGVIRKQFLERNLPLRGLYWLAKDLFEPGFQDVMEPEAQALYLIRNHLEHSYLKVHEMLIRKPKGDPCGDMWTDRLAYSLSRREFEAKALKVFRLTRAGLVYLSLGMHAEERRRAGNKPKGKRMPMELPILEDRWKT